MSLEKPEAGRPWYKRVTIVLGAILAATSSLEPVGVIAPGTTEAAAAAVTQILSSYGVLVGLYRHIAK